MPNPTEATHLSGARRGNPRDFENLVEPYRAELRLHCYRMLGSLLDADDMLQETLLRAWQRLDTFEARAPFRAWLYKIATNACLDALKRRARRSLPALTHPPANPGEPFAPPAADPVWLEPFPDALLPAAATPEARYSARESVRLAFLAALHTLPPRQRAVLLLRDVLDWRAREVADLLGTTVSAVNSALNRARVTLSRRYHRRPHDDPDIPPLEDEPARKLLEQYVQAWESANVGRLVALLKEDVTFAMPPSPTWYAGREAVRAFLAAAIFTAPTPGEWRLRPTRANARPAVGLFRRDPASGAHRPFAVQVLQVDGAHIGGIVTFLAPGLFSYFGLA